MSLTDWLLSGALVRFPGVRLAFSESQVGWMPYQIQRIDDVWHHHRGRSIAGVDHIPEPPSTYVEGRVFGCIVQDDFGIAVRGGSLCAAQLSNGVHSPRFSVTPRGRVRRRCAPPRDVERRTTTSTSRPGPASRTSTRPTSRPRCAPRVFPPSGSRNRQSWSATRNSARGAARACRERRARLSRDGRAAHPVRVVRRPAGAPPRAPSR
jgi:hypothetical protein